ncbi:MAG TPA: hypothetical protein VK698_25670 [Kofleriaceae bacterium]|nr:hypothetical protein [Kofleriaceae bacterium]
MRRSIRAIPLLASTPTLIAALALAVAPGCKKKEKAAEQTAEPESGSTGVIGTKKPGGRFRNDGLSARLGLEPVTVAEVGPLTPQLTGAQPLGQPTQTAGGRRVTAMQCMDGTDVDKIKAELEAQLNKLGFAPIRSSPRGKRDLVTLSADKPPFRFSATVRTGPYPDCPADQKKVKVLMSWFKRSPRPKPPVGAAPGATPTPGGTAPQGAAAPQGGAPKTAPAAPTAPAPSGSASGAAQ